MESPPASPGPPTVGTPDVNVSVPPDDASEPSEKQNWMPSTQMTPAKIIIILLVILVVLLLVLLIVICAIYIGVTCAPRTETTVTEESTGTQPYNSTTEQFQEAFKVCRTAPCYREAAYFRKMMDLRAKPCEDFYTYVCGGWMNETSIPKERGRWSRMDMIRNDVTKKGIELLENPEIVNPKGAVENAKAFYQGCVDTENIGEKQERSPLKKILIEIGGFPLIFEEWYNEKPRWTQRLVQVLRELGSSLLIIFEVGVDEKDTSKHTIYLDQMEDFGIERGILLHPNKDEQSRKVMKAYKEYIVNCVCFFRTSCTNRERKAIELEVDNLVTFESKIAKLTKPPEERRDAFKTYNRVTLLKLSKIAPKIPFYHYFHEVFKGTDQKVDDSFEVVLREQKYYKDLGELMWTSKKRTVANYLGWRIVQALGPKASASLRKLQFDFSKVTRGVKKPISIEERCFAFTNNVFDYAVGSIYVKKHFPPSAKAHMEELVKNVRLAFKSILKKTSWMDHNTKKEANKKLEEMQQKIGFPEWILNNKELDKYFELPKPVNREEFILSYNAIQRVMVKKHLKKLREPFNRTFEWTSAPAVVNAYYNQIDNSITFPAGILNQPFFQDNIPSVFNYGAIGIVIGHEITHGYDDRGRQYDSKGNLRNWWSDNTLKEFNTKKKCLIEQYGNILEPQTNLKVNGRNTIGENIADNGGIREAFLAFMMSTKDSVEERLPSFESITAKQWFFIASGNIWCTKSRKEALRDQIMNDEHTPGNYRAIIPQSNHDEFAKAFNCSLGSKMNPRKKCVLW